ncbi:acriflavin resistance protein [Roseibium aquae]|uniref:Acriflavin resistance protein n=1 Tax=Roseibium aquae TaxID=1323746 RepID=A0A916TMT3_9HYPH|nr:efflux RND transporter periplasmic adaptor subunit [Roseibium aquae]GGB62022.1 acriflavin resistance protein [Roseibium aquae]
MRLSFFPSFPRAAVVSGVCLALLAGCSDESQQAAPQAPPPSVSVAAAQTKEVRQSAQFVGQVAAVDQVSLVARVSGFLETKHVNDGAFVKEGDLLFSIEKAQYKAALDRAKAGLASAKADAALKAANEKRDLDLFQKGHVSEAAYEATLALKEQAEAAVQSADAAMQNAALDLGYTDIKAPFPGQIGKTTYSVGEVVGPNTQPLAQLIRQAPVYVNFAVSESQYLDAVKTHDINPDDIDPSKTPDLSLILPNGRTFDEKGKIFFIDNKVDPATGTVAFRGQFDNANGLLLAGTFVTVIIEAPQETKALMIPQAAVQRDQKGSFVLVVGQQETVEQRYVQLGDQIDGDFIVTDGLQEGERLIVEGLQKVRPGVPVNAVLASQPAGQS